MVNKIVSPQTLTPRIVTFDDLKKALSRYLHTKSAERDLHDLWKMGAPIPNKNPNAPEKRVLLPNQFAAWWQQHIAPLGVSQDFTFNGVSFTAEE